MRRIVFIVFVTLIVLAGYFAFEWAVGALVHSRRVVMVPDLSGKVVGDALNLLSQNNLGLSKEGEQFDKNYPAGTVVHQTPAPGMMVREGRIVRIILSQGGETLFVPDLVNQPLRNAQTMLQNTGLSIGQMERRPSLRYDKDVVMLTDPAANAIVSKNALINLVISDGPPGADTLLTPDFVGRSLAQAKEWATNNQVNLVSQEEADLTKPEGEVLQQAPVADAPIRAGDTLTVVANSANASTNGPHVHYEVPQGANDRDIRVLVIDESGEREVYRKAQAPGSKIDVPVDAKGHARARIFVNGIMVEEQDLQ